MKEFVEKIKMNKTVEGKFDLLILIFATIISFLILLSSH